MTHSSATAANAEPHRDTIEVVLESQYKKRIFLDVRELQVGRFDEKLLTIIEQTPSFILILSRGCLDRCVRRPTG